MKLIGVHMDRCTGCKTCELYCGAERGSEGRRCSRPSRNRPFPSRACASRGSERIFPPTVPALFAGALPGCLSYRRAYAGREERDGNHPRGSLHRMLDMHRFLSLRSDNSLL